MCCGSAETGEQLVDANQEKEPRPIQVQKKGNTLKERFSPPTGYSRLEAAENSFGSYLQNLSLKPEGTKVKYYDGNEKPASGVYCAVVDLDIGRKDLHQCADAVMRLRAEYLWNQKRCDEIHFNFTNGFRVDYSEYMQGKRMVVEGNKTYWQKKAAPSNTYEDFWSYMELIFTYAGTLSLSNELPSVNIMDMQIGDVFIQGGSPGHAVIVVDMAINHEGEKLFMLAQSYMPAQETQILINPNYEEISPWYELDFMGQLHTPEWSFSQKDLKRF